MPNPDPSQTLDGVAIIAMSGRWPGAKNPEAFWQNLANGVETISRFREDELEYSVATPSAKAQGQTFVRARSVLEDVDLFDAAFFGIYPREAEIMDPQHRLFLECAWEAIEAAGYDSESYPGLIGTYAGLSLNTYLLYNLISSRGFAANFAGNYQVGAYQLMLGNDKDFLPTRVSYKLNLRGPSMAIQCACSTSLVAVCQACTALLNFQCDMALAGGSSISFPQKRDYLYSEESMVSGDGTCRAFDAAACGTVFGHGVAVVLLKRAADALADGDNILAIIKGTALNNDGAGKIGYAAPSVNAQADVIAMAQAAAGVDPDTVSYIEAHGTATPLGDPIEVAALTKAFREGGARRNGYCAIGTGKTNIGHIDVAAGATGLIKTVLQLQHEKIAPLLYFKSPNPKIDFANSPFFPVSKLMDWKRGTEPRRAGVSAFGVGGTNAHVVVEEAPESALPAPSRPSQLLVLSAKTPAALDRMTANLANHLEQNPEICLADVAHTLQAGRRRFTHRRVCVCRDTSTAIAALRSADPKLIPTASAGGKNPPVVFLFPGQGAQYVNMGRELYSAEPVFREQVDLCAEILKPALQLDLRTLLYPPDGHKEEVAKQLTQTSITQPALFAIEYALARLWISWGVQPAAMVGHSLGEYVAAVLAGVMTLEEGLALLTARARMMQSMPSGGMLSVRLPEADLQPLLSGSLAIAVVNSAKLTVVSGPHDELDALRARLDARQTAHKTLWTSHAYHSPMMEPIVEPFTRRVGEVRLSDATIPIISTLTGKWIEASEWAQPDYWARQLRHTVRFADAAANLTKLADHVLLEVGPGQTLSTLLQQRPDRQKEQIVLASMPPVESTGEPAALLNALGRLWLADVTVDWAGFYARERRRRVPLPTYPFERRRFWVEPTAVDQSDTGSPNGTPSTAAIQSPDPTPAAARPLAANPSPVPAETAGPAFVEAIINEQMRLMKAQLEALEK
jgi:acyl transferase domain-containing protein